MAASRGARIKPHRMGMPAGVVRAGISVQEHQAHLLKGEEWCSTGAHYVIGTRMSGHFSSMCIGCASVRSKQRVRRRA